MVSVDDIMVDRDISCQLRIRDAPVSGRCWQGLRQCMRVSRAKCRLERTPECCCLECLVCADKYEVHEVLHAGTGTPGLPITPRICVDLFGNVLRQWNGRYQRRLHLCKLQQPRARQQIRLSRERGTKADI